MCNFMFLKTFVLMFVLSGIVVGNKATAGAVFYMTQRDSSLTATVQAPGTVVVGANYDVTIPFPSSSIMLGNALLSPVCDKPNSQLRRNWALAVPDELNFKSINNGPVLRFTSVNGGWIRVGNMNINGAKYIVLWSTNTNISVPCNDFLTSYLGVYNGHQFGGPATFLYEVVDPGKPGSGSVSLPSGNIAGFLYANLRREDVVTESKLQSYVLHSPEVFSSNRVQTTFSWVTRQTCAADSLDKTVDFGILSVLDIVGKKKVIPLTLSCKGGTETPVSIAVSNNNEGGTDVALGHGVFADVEVPSRVTIPLNGEKKVNISVTLKGRPEGGGKLDGVAILKVNFL